jgi:type III secretion system-like peptide-binding chaperone
LKLKDAEGEICSGLLELTREGGPGNFMVISSGEIYVQFAGSPGNPKLLCESISNQYLPKKQQMSRKDIESLKSMGFVLGGDQIENFSRAYEITNEKQARELAGVTLQILQKVYGLKPADELQIEVSLE